MSDIGPDGNRRQHMPEDLVDVPDRCEADLRFVMSCDKLYLCATASDPACILSGNRVIHDLVQQAPGRLYGACTVNPNFLDESLRAMDKCYGEWGFVQLGEMLPHMMDYRMDSDEAGKVVRVAAQYDVPIQVHLGT